MPESQYFTNQRILKMPQHLPMKLRFSPDGKHLVVWGTHHKEVWVWNIETEKVIRKISKPKRADPDYVYGNNGDYLIGLRSRTKDKPKEYVLYETTKYQEVDAWPTPIAFHGSKATPDNMIMSYYSGRKKNEKHIKLRILDIPKKKIVNQISGVDGFDMVVFQPDGKGFADSTTDYEGDGDDNPRTAQYNIRLWSYPGLKHRLTIEGAHPAKVIGLAFSKDGKRLYSWSGSALSPEWLLEHTGKRVVRPNYKEPIRVWDTKTGEQIDVIDDVFAVISESSMYSLDDTHIAVATLGARGQHFTNNYDYISIINTKTKSVVDEFQYKEPDYIVDTRLSPNESTIATVNEQGVLLIDLKWDGLSKEGGLNE